MNSTKLAIDGGPPVRTEPLPPWPRFLPEDLDAARTILESGRVNYWTGPHGRAFEQEFARYCKTPHGVACCNGTVALELALEALGVSAGDEVIVPARTFIASASAIARRGARPVFADIDRTSQNLTADTVAPLLTGNSRGIVAVHLAGWPCEMDRLTELAQDRGIFIVEDCAQAHGARYCGLPVGGLGTVAAFSFCQDKIMTTAGEGGIVVTTSESLAHRIWSLKDHGKDYSLVHQSGENTQFRWVHRSLGTNARMSEVQAALGRTALARLDGEVERRRAHAKRLNSSFSSLPSLRTTLPADHIGHAYYKYYVFLRPEALRKHWTRDRILEAITAEGVPCFSGICSEVYREAAFPDRLRPPQRLSVARELGETSLMFQIHPTLSGQDVDDVVRATTKVMTAATR